ncbi:hypothetical protein [Vibrio sp. JZG10]
MINLFSNPSVMIFQFKLLISELLRKVTAGIAQSMAFEPNALFLHRCESQDEEQKGNSFLYWRNDWQRAR